MVNINQLNDPTYVNDNCVELIECLANSCSSDRTACSSRDLAWACIAKIICSCEPSSLKAITSRIHKRLIDSAHQQITNAILYFLYAVLKKLPWLKSKNADTLNIVISKALDFAVGSNQSAVVRLAADIFVLWASNCQYNDLLLALEAATTQRVDTAELIDAQFVCWKIKRNQCSFVVAAFLIHSTLIKTHPCSITFVNKWLSRANDALQMHAQPVSDAVFMWLRTLIVHSGYAILYFSNNIVNLLLRYHHSSSNFYKCLEALFYIGLPSSGCLLLKKMSKEVARPLHLQVYGKEFADAVNVSLHGCLLVWDVEDLNRFQRTISDEMLIHPHSFLTLRILTMLVACCSELIPAATGVVQTVIWRSTNSEKFQHECLRSRVLCSRISRSFSAIGNWIGASSSKVKHSKENSKRLSKRKRRIADFQMEGGRKILKSSEQQTEWVCDTENVQVLDGERNESPKEISEIESCILIDDTVDENLHRGNGSLKSSHEVIMFHPASTSTVRTSNSSEGKVRSEEIVVERENLYSLKVQSFVDASIIEPLSVILEDFDYS